MKILKMRPFIFAKVILDKMLWRTGPLDLRSDLGTIIPWHHNTGDPVATLAFEE